MMAILVMLFAAFTFAAQLAPSAGAPRISQAEFKKLRAAKKVLVVDTRNEDAYRRGHIPGAILLPLEGLQMHPETELYLGLIHYNDESGDAARLAAARRHARVDGIGTECGMARGDPARLPALLAAHAKVAESAG